MKEFLSQFNFMLYDTVSSWCNLFSDALRYFHGENKLFSCVHDNEDCLFSFFQIRDEYILKPVLKVVAWNLYHMKY